VIAARSIQRRYLFLGVAEARFQWGCGDHFHAFTRRGYRSQAFPEDARA